MTIAWRIHLFSFRTQKLSFSAPKVLAGWPAGRIGRCHIIFLDSSAAEHPAVNRRVVGSNPTRGAKKTQILSAFFVFHWLFSTPFRLFVKCWGVDYKISQYNIFGYQNLSVSRSIKVYVFWSFQSFCNRILCRPRTIRTPPERRYFRALCRLTGVLLKR